MKASTILIDTIPLLDKYSSQILRLLAELDESQRIYLPQVFHDEWMPKRDPVVWRKDFIANNIGKSSDDKQLLYYLISDSETDDILGLIVIYANRALKSINVDLLYIEPKYRNKGVATTILQQLKSRSKQAKYKVITISVATDNVAAKRTYAKAGYKSFREDQFVKL